VQEEEGASVATIKATQWTSLFNNTGVNMTSNYVDVIKGNLDIFDEACRESTYYQARRDLFLDLVSDSLIPDRWSDFKRVMDLLRPNDLKPDMTIGDCDREYRSADSKQARFKEANNQRQDKE
jgi:hypothetical protein